VRSRPGPCLYSQGHRIKVDRSATQKPARPNSLILSRGPEASIWMLVWGCVSDPSGASRARQFRRQRRTSAHPNPRMPSGSKPRSPASPPRKPWPADQAGDKLPHRRPPLAPSTTRKSGKSDPTSTAMPSLSAAGNSFFKARSRPIRAATAFPDPAPNPPCTGNRFRC